MAELVVTKEVPTFLKKKHELSGMLKQLEGVSKEIIEDLVETTRDEKVDIKTKTNIRLDLLKLQAAIADQISKDQMARTIAEVKIGGATRNLSAVPEDTGPRLDFTTIHPDFADAKIVDLSNVKSIG